MRTLKFIVDGQSIVLDSSCSLDGLTPGTTNYLRAKFDFSKEWINCTKVAAFYSNLGVEYEPQVIKSDGTCDIPVDVLKKSIFKVRVIGQRGDYIIRTDKVAIRQKGGRS